MVCKKAKSDIPQLLGTILILTVGVGFFMTLYTIALRYEETAEQYFIDQAYADITVHGVFDNESVRLISELDGVALAQSRVVRDFREGGRTFRAISLTVGINIPYLYEGRLPLNESEIVILNRNAEAMGFSLGDYLTLADRNFVITGLAASPEYIYMVQNQRNIRAHTGYFAVVFLLDMPFSTEYNEVVMLTSGQVSVNEILEIPGVSRVVMRDSQINYLLYHEQLERMRSFALIFPFVFAALIAIVIYVTLSRTIQKDRKQIGIMKALGVSDAKIIGIYLPSFCLAALIGALLGGFVSVIFSDIIIGVFSSMFEVPTLGYAFYPSLWLLTLFVSILLCAISSLIALSAILPLLPAHAMRSRTPKGRRAVRRSPNPFARASRLSFNTRYALKNALRNKGRFLAVVLGMCGSCALLTFSLAFNDSVIDTQNRHFSEFVNYDVIVSFDPIPRSITHPVSEKLDESQKALIIPVEIFGSDFILAIVENDFDMLNIPAWALQDGVIIPEFFAEEWGVGIGDILQINGNDVVVSAIVPQFLGLMLFAGFDHMGEVLYDIPPIYNTIYGRSANMAALSTFLIYNSIDFSTVDDDKVSFASLMEVTTILIAFMLLCAVILGVAVLYSVGMINLSAREYEYMFMGVMGYPHKKILTAHIKETIVQLVLAIPFGFLGGYLIQEGIKGEFSNDSFVISTAISLQSYIISAGIVIAMTVIMAMVTSWHINKLDIVEGLKVQDD